MSNLITMKFVSYEPKLEYPVVARIKLKVTTLEIKA